MNFLPKPIPGVDTAVEGAIKLVAYLANFAAQLEALGGAAMINPLPTVNDSEDVWGIELNAYLTELEQRVIALQLDYISSPGGDSILGGGDRIRI